MSTCEVVDVETSLVRRDVLSWSNSWRNGGILGGWVGCKTVISLR